MTPRPQFVPGAHLTNTRLHLRSGDVVVLSAADHLTKDQADAMVARVQREIGDDVRVLVLSGGIEMSVMRRS